ncbi:MAG: UPF0716 protein FxsA [Paracoccaceae bacterium]|jgi:UPF0716 protein FxsA
MPLLLALIIVPIIEIALFIQVGGWIGLLPTIAIVILTALIGSALLRAQGAGALRDLQSSLRGDGNPGAALANGALILVAGVLLLTPGFFTDAVGFALLVPALRAGVIAWGAKRMVAGVHVAGFAVGPAPRKPGGPQEDDVIEGEWESVDDDDPRPRPPSGWTRPPE